MDRKPIAKVTHYFPKIGVAVLALKGSLKTGDAIEIEKDGIALKQVVKSMQVEHVEVKKATKGMDIGLKVDDVVKPGAMVYINN